MMSLESRGMNYRHKLARSLNPLFPSTFALWNKAKTMNEDDHRK